MNKKGVSPRSVAVGLLIIVILLVLLYPTVIKPLIIEPAKGLKDCGFYKGVCENKAWTLKNDKIVCAKDYLKIPAVYCDEEKKQPCCKPAPGTEITETPPTKPKTEEKKEEESKREIDIAEEAIEEAKKGDTDKYTEAYQYSRQTILDNWQNFDEDTITAFKILLEARQYIVTEKFPDDKQCKIFAVVFRDALERSERSPGYIDAFERLLESKNNLFDLYGNELNYPNCDKIKAFTTMDDFNKEENKQLLIDDISLDRTHIDFGSPEEFIP